VIAIEGMPATADGQVKLKLCYHTCTGGYYKWTRKTIGQDPRQKTKYGVSVTKRRLILKMDRKQVRPLPWSGELDNVLQKALAMSS
jgi:hypothetical protein